MSHTFTDPDVAYAYMRQHLASRPVIFEIGMCDGKDTERLLSWSLNPIYYGFEPDPRNVSKIAAKGLPSRIHFHEAAMGHVTEAVPLYLSTPNPDAEVASSSISEFTPELTKRWPWLTCEGQIIVQCWRLDDFCQWYKIDHIDFVWMDCQGAERMVFEGAPEMLKKTKVIWTEFDDGTLYRDSSTAKDILTMLPGWKVIADTGSDMLLENPNA